MPYQHSKKPFAKRSLGQNFLVDTMTIDRIIKAFSPSSDDTVVEIGPGRGALTERLVELARLVFAIEFDRDLAALLQERFGGKDNFRLVEADALSYDFTELADGGRARLIANLPYNISTAILQRLAEQAGVFSDCVLMFQREVVDRITAPPGNTDRGFLTVVTEASFSVERLFDVPPGAFRPAPKVWSSVVRLRPLRIPSNIDRSRFRELVAVAFGQKRKTILNNLKSRYSNASQMLEAAGIDPRRRAESLSLDEWIKLAVEAA